ncbi:Gfo/Idh/MocA family protein [Virgibacillus pantothenticus]|uniref:Gfo/Idh/MocA family protein n=1 Tax=Virgibacillus pantothenticus TaxID=1473 RepID=UPI0009841B21|nr:Gfo/Idh/MocA family oxidoreductase [Virgibacillus pantothenticus]
MKFCTIGTSWITEAFIDAANRSGDAQLAAVYSRKLETAQAFANKHGAVKAYTDITEILEADECDFVYIASPNILHPDHIKIAIQSGKHVFCEKPMVFTDKQWQEIAQLSKAHQVFVFEGFRHLFSPNYQRLKKELTNIGAIRSALLQYGQYSSRYDKYREGAEPNVFSPQFAGGALMDLGVYPLSMAIDLFGQPKDFSYYPVLLKNGIDGSGTMVLTYDGFIVTLLCSKITNAFMQSEIHGEDGTLIMDAIAPISQLQLHDRKTAQINELANEQYEADMVFEIQAFVEMVSENNWQLHDSYLERSRTIAQLTEKMRKENGIHFPNE